MPYPISSPREVFLGTYKKQKEEPHEFFTHALPTHFLKPAMTASLQSLSLYSSLYWGFYPHFNLEGMHFPLLKSLTLGNFSFYTDTQLDWILSHGHSLQELYLDDCPILFYISVFRDEEDTPSDRCPIPKSDMRRSEKADRRLDYAYPRRWYDYFRAFEDGLQWLREFGFGVNAAWGEDGLPFERERDIVPALKVDRYMGFDAGIGPSQVTEHMDDSKFGAAGRRPVCDDEDRDALKRLCARIGKRVDCGWFRVGSCMVENLVQTNGRGCWLY